MEFHLLIVDDEAPIRKGLSHFIDWGGIDCVVDDTASDGLEAIEKLSEHSIDIIITDIKMPDADGIALAKYVHENHPEIMVIILTGYADFTYAQTAIAYNVVEFLLKPTSKESLVHAVQNAQKQIISSKKQNLSAREEIAFLKERLLQELTDAPFRESLCVKLENYQIPLDGYYIAAFRLLSPEGDLLALKNIMNREENHHYCYRYNNLILSIYNEKIGTKQVPHTILNHCGEILNIVTAISAWELSVGISGHHAGAWEFSTAVSEAIQTLTMNFYAEENIAVYSPSTKVEEYILTAEDTLILYHIETALINWDFQEAAQQVHSLFHKLTTNFAKSIDIKNIGTQIYYIGSRVLMKKGLAPPDAHILTAISQSSAIFQLEDIMNGMLRSIETVLSNNGKQYSQIIENAIRYIHQNLGSPLSLDAIAGYIHVNPSHLSRTFKKECGQPITEYINQVRVEKARELLLSPHTLAYEIAEEVGFHDPAYFSFIFKKYTGCSPKEYKLQHQ